MDAVSNPKYSNIFASLFMDDCRHLVKQIPQTCFKHCFREANWCADALARMGGFQDANFTVFEIPAVDISNLLDSGFNGLYLNRLYLVTLFAL